jgi:chromosome segregation ATPase
MPEQFVNVFKANAHIRDLAAQLSAVTAERDAAKTELATAQATIAAYDPAIEATAAQLQTDLNAANAKVTQLDADLATARLSIASITKERDDANAKITDPKGAIQTAAANKALEITAAQGQPVPIKTGAVTSPGNGDATMKRADFSALSPNEQSKFIRTGGKVVD